MFDPEPMIAVDLWSARIPGFARFAEHHWFVIGRPGSADRWEVWQSPHQCDDAWGHLHLNLCSPSSGVGNGRGRLIYRWLGSAASDLASRIEAAPSNYPWLDTYRVFPGPNSNTFVQWVLGDIRNLGWRGVGRRFAWRSP
jgi:hypothetical protein